MINPNVRTERASCEIVVERDGRMEKFGYDTRVLTYDERGRLISMYRPSTRTETHFSQNERVTVRR